MVPSRRGRPRIGLRAVVAAALALGATSGCVRRTVTTEIVDITPVTTQQQQMKSASNLPSRFEVVTPPRIESDCPSRLRDPELQALLTLSHSLMLPSRDTTASGRPFTVFGDYAIQPAGSYGDEPGEGLRVDCGRLRGLGLVQLLRE
jgi:hypothetical protein